MNSFNKKINNNLKIVLLIMFFVLVSSFAKNTNAQVFDFYRSLKIGDQGQDVLNLQKVLNQSMDTSVSFSGVGSAGNETTYFGQLTKTALIKFQNKYSDQVLKPVGLSVGTGYFGPSTIDFIENYFNSSSVTISDFGNTTEPNQNIQSSKTFEELIAEINSIKNFSSEEDVVVNIDETVEIKEYLTEDNSDGSDTTGVNVESSQNTSDLTNQQQKLVRSADIEVYYVSQMVFESGDDLTVVGTGINKDSEIYFFNFENDKVIGSVDIESNFIFFNAPNLPEGKYELYIKNGNFISKPAVVEIVNNYNPPKISSISPSTISYGDTVTIKGSNFENQNIVMTALGTYQAVSNGKEIKVFIQRQANLPFETDPKEQKIEGLIQIQNSKGVSDAKFVNFIYN